MDKIRALLEQLGGSKELVDQIATTLVEYQANVDATVKEDYKLRLEKAKEACLEEVNTYKRDLARKFQIFCESKVEKIEQQIAKQVAVKDSAAEAKLQAIASLLEGVEVNGGSNNADLLAAQKQVKELRESLNKASNAVKILTEKANRSHSIAEKTLERNKVLSKELVEATTKKTTVAESKKAPKKVVAEDRKPQAPATTRKSSAEQIAKPAKAAGATEQPAKVMGGLSPEAIAAQIE